jgi:hypothetical protein
MKRLLNMLAMTIGGYIGWWLGAFVSIFTAFIISMVGTGLGLYGAQRLSKRLLP